MHHGHHGTPGLKIFLGFLIGAGLGTLWPLFPRLSILSGLLFLFLFIRSRSSASAVLLVMGGLLVVLYSSFAPLHEKTSNAHYAPMVIDGYFTTAPQEVRGGYSQRFFIMGSKGTGISGEIPVLSSKPFEVGARYSLLVKLVNPRQRLNPWSREPDTFAYLEDAARVDDAIIMTPQVTVNRMRAKLDAEIKRLFAPQEAALISAVTTGARLRGGSELREDYRASGLAHLFSISGTHFGFFALLLFGALRLLLTRIPRLWLERLCEHITPSELAAIISIPFMLGYLFLSGARVPSVRAFIMTGMFMLGLLMGRRGGWMPFLMLAASVIVFFDPQAMSSLSFQMSFLAVLFIGMIVWGSSEMVEPPPYVELPRWQVMLRYLRGLVLITLAATAGVLPLVAYFFHYVSLISPVANFLAGPLVSMALVPFSLLGAFSYLLTGYYITWPVVEVLAQATNWLAGAFASVPKSSVHVPAFPLAGLLVYYAGFALWFWKRHRKAFLLVPVCSVITGVLLLGFFSPLDTDSMRVIFPDAGRADTAIIELPDNSGTLVVDTGWRGSVAASYLRTRGIKDITALILTHAHADHAGGAARLVRDFNVHEVWDAGWSKYDPLSPLGRIPRKSLKRGDVISGKGYEILVLHPYVGYESLHDGAKGVNDRSLVFRITGGGASYLFTADIGLDAVNSMSGLAPKWLSSDVIKAPHHGREPEALYTLLRRSRANKLVITAPKVHKSIKDIKPLWPELDVMVTGMDGAISLSAKAGEIQKSLYAESMLKKSPTLSEERGNLLRLFRSWP